MLSLIVLSSVIGKSVINRGLPKSIAFIGIIECYSSHARIGNYSQYIPDYNLCGISRNWLQNPDKCFKYHQNMFVPMINAREVVNGEAPWIVLVQIVLINPWFNTRDELEETECTGSLISTQWILTAAQCYDRFKNKETEVKIVFGKYRNIPLKTIKASLKPVIHPLYHIALVKMDNPVNIVNKGEYYETNMICLPPNDISLIEDEPSLTSGWGFGHNNGLQICGGIMSKGNETFFKQSPFKKDQTYCSGDSGSPIWQYHRGRAVQLGVMKSAPEGFCWAFAYGVYLPKVVDWIIVNIKS